MIEHLKQRHADLNVPLSYYNQRSNTNNTRYTQEYDPPLDEQEQEEEELREEEEDEFEYDPSQFPPGKISSFIIYHLLPL